MRKTFRYRIFPTHKQTLEGCSWLYNYFLEQRKNAWESEKKSLSRYDQSNTLKTLKIDHQKSPQTWKPDFSSVDC